MEIDNKLFRFIYELRFKKLKFESVPEEMSRSEVLVELVIKIFQAHDELKCKKKTVKRNRQSIPV
jgi:hypothetical protein